MMTSTRVLKSVGCSTDGLHRGRATGPCHKGCLDQGLQGSTRGSVMVQHGLCGRTRGRFVLLSLCGLRRVVITARRVMIRRALGMEV